MKWSDLPCLHLQIQNNLQHFHTLLPLYLAYKHTALPHGGGGGSRTKAATRPCAVAFAVAVIGLEKTYMAITSFTYILHTWLRLCPLIASSPESSIVEKVSADHRTSKSPASHFCGVTHAFRVHMFTLHAIIWWAAF